MRDGAPRSVGGGGFPPPPRLSPPGGERRPPRLERVTKRPLGWLAERLARPLIRWDRARLETPEIAVPVAGLPPGLVGYRLALVTDLHHGPAVPTWWLGRMAEDRTSTRL